MASGSRSKIDPADVTVDKIDPAEVTVDQPHLDPNYTGPTLSARSGQGLGEAAVGEVAKKANAIPQRMVDAVTPDRDVKGAMGDKPDTEDADREAALKDHPWIKGLMDTLGSAPAAAFGGGLGMSAQNASEEGRDPTLTGALSPAGGRVIEGILPEIMHYGGRGIRWLGSKLSAGWEAMEAERVAGEEGARRSAQAAAHQARGELHGMYQNAPDYAANAPSQDARAAWNGVQADPRVQGMVESVASNVPDRTENLLSKIQAPLPTVTPARAPTLRGAVNATGQGMKSGGASLVGAAIGGTLTGGTPLGMIQGGAGGVLVSSLMNPEARALVGAFGQKVGNAILNAAPDPGGWGQMLINAAKNGADSIAATHYVASQKPGYQTWWKAINDDGQEDQTANVR